MNENLKTLSMLEVAEYLLKNNKKPMTIQELIKQVADIKGVSLEDYDRLTQLYMDITQSAKFVYCGDDQWDLKERNLELWDKDGYAFVHADDVEEDVEEDLDFKEFVLEDEEEEIEEDEEEIEEEIDEESKEEKAYIDIDLPIKSTDEDDGDDDIEIEFDDDNYDEDDYNEIMDDYEDLYEE
jgi:DNA-directed RNA polymerase subunit delta